jgi:hypothetical protein
MWFVASGETGPFPLTGSNCVCDVPSIFVEVGIFAGGEGSEQTWLDLVQGVVTWNVAIIFIGDRCEMPHSRCCLFFDLDHVVVS